jgi:hypothetical protein
MTNPDRRAITSFAIVMGLALSLIAAWRWYRGTAQWVVLALVAIAAVLLVLAAIAPSLLTPVYRGWMKLGALLGWVNTRVLLTLVFFLVVTPIGVIMRLLGRSPLEARKRDSYWTDAEADPRGDRHVEKQF